MGCSVMKRDGSNAYCKVCQCSYGDHIHMWEEMVEVEDHKAMQALKKKIDDQLKDCRR